MINLERFTFRSSCARARLSALYARRAQLDQAIRALERMQRMRERRTCSARPKYFDKFI